MSAKPDEEYDVASLDNTAAWRDFAMNEDVIRISDIGGHDINADGTESFWHYENGVRVEDPPPVDDELRVGALAWLRRAWGRWFE